MAMAPDAPGYITKCSGEGIYFAAKSGRMAAEAIVQLVEGASQAEIEKVYLAPYDKLYGHIHSLSAGSINGCKDCVICRHCGSVMALSPPTTNISTFLLSCLFSSINSAVICINLSINEAIDTTHGWLFRGWYCSESFNSCPDDLPSLRDNSENLCLSRPFTIDIIVLGSHSKGTSI